MTDRPSPKSILAAALGPAAAIFLLVAGSTWRSRAPVRPETPGEQLSLAWQRAHCPREAQAGLDEIALPHGRIADVEIVELPQARLYLPRPWTAATQHSMGPAPDGMSLMTGGSGTDRPWRGAGSTEPCRGIRFVSIPGERGDDPRFTLDLIFPFFSTASSEGRMERQSGPYPYAHQARQFAFFGPEDGDPDGLPLLRLPQDGSGAEALGDGWRVLLRNTRDSFRRIAYDAAAPAGTTPAKAVEVLEGWALVFPVAPRVRARIVVDRAVPASRWRLYGRKAERAYRWLKTAPARRGALPRSL